jgi:hypothetical protein
VEAHPGVGGPQLTKSYPSWDPSIPWGLLCRPRAGAHEPPAAHEDAIWLRWEAIGAKLGERGRRLFAAAEVR